MPRILIADDSIIFRRFMNDIISSFEDYSVVGQAHNGKVTLQKIQELEPDIVTLDMEMPEIDGIQVLKAIQNLKKKPSVIVVSSLTERGGSLTLKALQLGAFDFITKPQTGSLETARNELTNILKPRIRALSLRHKVRGILERKPASALVEKTVDADSNLLYKGQAVQSGNVYVDKATSIAESDVLDAPKVSIAKTVPQEPKMLPIPKIKPQMIVMGVSTGGPNALNYLIPSLPYTIGVPIFIVQHMPPLFTQSLALSLQKKTSMPVVEAQNNTIAKPGCVYIAPGGKHMRIHSNSSDSILIQITDDSPENNCKPSVDYLFRSASQAFPGRALSVILTGMGSDGTLGVRLLKRTGCVSLVQDESSCVVYGMPKSVVDAGLADAVIPLNQLAETITNILRRWN